MFASALAEIGASHLFALVMFGIGLLTMVTGTAIYLANLNKDVPSLDSPARTGWALIMLSGLIIIFAVVFSLAVRG